MQREWMKRLRETDWNTDCQYLKKKTEKTILKKVKRIRNNNEPPTSGIIGLQYQGI